MDEKQKHRTCRVPVHWFAMPLRVTTVRIRTLQTETNGPLGHDTERQDHGN